MLTQETLKTLLNYNAETGIFTWKISNNQVIVGEKAGTIHNKGYIAIKLQGKSYLAHRLVWLYIHGSLPIRVIDHKDQNKQNNALENLREVTLQINSQNLPQYKSNTSGVVGVKWHKRDSKWEAQITVNKKRIYLGSFKTKTMAILIRKKAEVSYGFHKNHGKIKL